TSVISITDVLCNNGNDGISQVNLLGGTSPYSYQWDINTAFQNGATATGLAAGQYIVSINDNNACFITDTAIINEPSVITVTTTPNSDTICPGQSVAIGALATGGVGNYTYQWNNGLPPNQSQNVSPSGDTVYLITVTDGNGCNSAPASIAIFVMNLVFDSLQMSVQDNICPGESGSVSASFIEEYPPYIYQWGEIPETTLGTFSVSPIVTTTYYITITDQCSNSISDSILFNVFQLPDVSITPAGISGCEPLIVDFESDGDNSSISAYSWSFGDGGISNDQNPTYTFNNSGIYTVNLSIITNDGCSVVTQGSTQITVNPVPDIECEATPNTTDIRTPEIDFTLTSTDDIVIFEWDFGDGDTSSLANPQHTYSDTGTYMVNLIVTNQYGCVAECDQLVIITPYYELNVPNAFVPSPSGGSGGAYDPINISNEVFFPITKYIEVFHMEIYNRWGELIFVSDDLNIGWDGYYLGELCQQDVYVWKIRVTYTNGTQEVKAGDLTLIR
ncbi:MAG: PKD domain-containing protein, partial [Flavobacteriales bacterium]|nr:PKD domain-containing protein [Flavobacteriales bacterium]